MDTGRIAEGLRQETEAAVERLSLGGHSRVLGGTVYEFDGEAGSYSFVVQGDGEGEDAEAHRVRYSVSVQVESVEDISETWFEVEEPVKAEAV